MSPLDAISESSGNGEYSTAVKHLVTLGRETARGTKRLWLLRPATEKQDLSNKGFSFRAKEDKKTLFRAGSQLYANAETKLFIDQTSGLVSGFRCRFGATLVRPSEILVEIRTLNQLGIPTMATAPVQNVFVLRLTGSVCGFVFSMKSLSKKRYLKFKHEHPEIECTDERCPERLKNCVHQ
ncbi:hypothetical protein ACU8KH_01344 [Lachancea thermotolerans]